MKGRVLVTGGAGFIGSHTVDLLLARNYEVRVLDSLQPRVHPHGKPDYLPAEVDFRQGEVENPGDLLRALQGVDCVLHLAAYQDYMPDFSRFLHVNAESTALLYELILAHRLPVRQPTAKRCRVEPPPTMHLSAAGSRHRTPSSSALPRLPATSATTSTTFR